MIKQIISGLFRNSLPVLLLGNIISVASATTYHGVNDIVYALTVDGSGNVYAGGGFNAAGSVSVQNVAVWNRSQAQWSPLYNSPIGYGSGDGVDGTVYALAVGSDGKIYVGGNFNSPGENLAVWDPVNTNWTSTIYGVDNATGSRPDSSTVYAMDVVGNNIYIVGKFAYVGANPDTTPNDGLRATNIAVWNTSTASWRNVGAPPPVGTPEAITTADGVHFYAGGTAGIADGVLSGGAIIWSNMDTNLTGNVDAIAIIGTNLFVGGNFYLPVSGLEYSCGLAQWNGSHFVNVPDAPFTPGQVSPGSIFMNDCSSLAVYNNKLIVAGSFSFYDNPNAPTYTLESIAQYDPATSTWQPVGPGTNSGVGYASSINTTNTGIINALALDNNAGAVYAGGYFNLANWASPPNYSVDNIALWNGAANTWSPLDNATSTVSIANPASGTTLPPGNIQITASATNTDGTIVEVDFYAGTNLLGTATSAPYTITWTNLVAGTYILTAAAVDNDGSVAFSRPTTLAIGAGFPSDIVAWWPAEGNGLDIINGHDGTLTNNVGFQLGEVGQAFWFGNSNIAAVIVPAATSLNIGSSNGFTLEAWIYPSNTSIGYPIFEWNSGSAYGVHFWEGSFGGAGSLYANIVGTNGQNHIFQSTGGVVHSNVFQHVALTYDKSSGIGKLYCNGVLAAQSSLGSFTPQATYKLYLGNRPLAGEIADFGGLIDEPAIFGHALAASNIAAIYDAGMAGKVPDCAPDPSGLVSWWPAEDDATDIISGNNGILEDGVGYAAGKVGQAFWFTGTNNGGVMVPASPSLNIAATNGAFTLEAWIYPSNTVIAGPIFEWNTGTNFGVHFWEGAFGGDGSLYGNIVDTSGAYHIFQSSGGVLTSNVFQHVALTYDPSTGLGKLYCNGVLITQSSLGSFTPQTSYDLYLGTRPMPIDPHVFSGLIDEPSIYNRALSDAEIRSIFSAGLTGKCR